LEKSKKGKARLSKTGRQAKEYYQEIIGHFRQVKPQDWKILFPRLRRTERNQREFDKIKKYILDNEQK